MYTSREVGYERDNVYNPADEETVYKYTPEFAKTYKRLLEFDVERDGVDGFGDEILQEIARAGMLCYPWELIKPIVAHKVEQVVVKYKLKKLDQTEEVSSRRLLKEQLKRCQTDQLELYDKLLAFENPPWTIQRLCELLLQKPETQHHTREAILFALLKLIKVTTTLTIITPQQYDRDTKENAKSIKRLKGTEENGNSQSLPKQLPAFPKLAFSVGISQKPSMKEVIVNVILYFFTFFTAILLWNSILISAD